MPSGGYKSDISTISTRELEAVSSWNVSAGLILPSMARSHVQLSEVRRHIVVSGKINT